MGGEEEGGGDSAYEQYKMKHLGSPESDEAGGASASVDTKETQRTEAASGGLLNWFLRKNPFFSQPATSVESSPSPSVPDAHPHEEETEEAPSTPNSNNNQNSTGSPETTAERAPVPEPSSRGILVKAVSYTHLTLPTKA